MKALFSWRFHWESLAAEPSLQAHFDFLVIFFSYSFLLPVWFISPNNRSNRINKKKSPPGFLEALFGEILSVYLKN